MTPKKIKIGPSRLDLQISYENGINLVIPSTFLRKFSPSAENKNNLNLENLKKFNGISISKLEAVGNYAIRVHFSDGHNTGIYSWEYLFSLGENLKVSNAHSK
jgi:DUF971 family protein